MTEPVILATFTFAGAVMLYLSQVAIAAVRGKPKSEPWNGTERRTEQLIDARINVHRLECPAMKQFYESLEKLRIELRTEMHSLHDEIQKSRV